MKLEMTAFVICNYWSDATIYDPIQQPKSSVELEVANIIKPKYISSTLVCRFHHYFSFSLTDRMYRAGGSSIRQPLQLHSHLVVSLVPWIGPWHLRVEATQIAHLAAGAICGRGSSCCHSSQIGCGPMLNQGFQAAIVVRTLDAVEKKCDMWCELPREVLVPESHRRMCDSVVSRSPWHSREQWVRIPTTS